MAFGSRKISVEILGDSRSLERAFARSAQSGQKMNVAFAGMGRAAAGAGLAFFGAQGVIQGLEDSVKIASNLAEQTAKSRQVFRGFSGDVEAWAKTTSEGFGIARDQALEAAGTFGNLFRTVHLAPAEISQMSRSLVELAADLASFNNTDPDDALLALRSGLVGEAEPLRRYGARLSEARVQQEALRATGKKTAKGLTEQEKALARYRIILEDTKTAHGDFARTQDGFANKTRKLSAAFRDLKGEIGTGLLPALTAVVDITAKAIKGANDLGRAYSKSEPYKRLYSLGGVIEGVAEKFGYGTSQADAYAAALERVESRSASLQSASLGMSGALSEHLALQRKRFSLAEKMTPEDEPVPTKRYSREQANDWWDAAIGRQRDRVQDVENLQGQVAALEKIAAQIEARIRVTKDVTRKLNLEDQLLQTQRDIKSTRETIRARTEQVREERAELAKEAAERAALARETAQFAALGFGPGGADLVPGVQALRKRLARVSDVVRGTFLDTSKTRSVLKSIRRALSGGLGELSDDVRAKVEEMLADIDRKLAEHQRRRARHRVIDTDKVLAGLGLSREQIRALSGRIGQIGKGGTVPLGGPAAFGVRLAGTGSTYVINGGVTVKADHPDAIARELQKRARRQATQTRGVRPGSRQGIDG